MNNIPQLIVMLTQNDMTVRNAIEVFEESKNAPAKFWGFKEKGIPQSEIKELVKRMKASGKTVFLEVVEYTEDECLEGAKIGIECGFDVLMGTMYFPSVMKLVKDKPIKYMPFVGDIHGRPSIMDGTIDGMINDAKKLINEGVDGFDLLGYRYTGDPEELNEKFVKSVNAPVCLAGSIASYERLDRVKKYGPWAFTIGSAFFENKFGKDLTFAEQVTKVCEYMKK